MRVNNFLIEEHQSSSLFFFPPLAHVTWGRELVNSSNQIKSRSAGTTVVLCMCMRDRWVFVARAWSIDAHQTQPNRTRSGKGNACTHAAGTRRPLAPTPNSKAHWALLRFHPPNLPAAVSKSGGSEVGVLPPSRFIRPARASPSCALRLRSCAWRGHSTRYGVPWVRAERERSRRPPCTTAHPHKPSLPQPAGDTVRETKSFQKKKKCQWPVCVCQLAPCRFVTRRQRD